MLPLQAATTQPVGLSSAGRSAKLHSAVSSGTSCWVHDWVLLRRTSRSPNGGNPPTGSAASPGRGPSATVSAGAGGASADPSHPVTAAVDSASAARPILILLSSLRPPISPSIPTLSWQSQVLAPPGAGPEPHCRQSRPNGDLWSISRV